MVEAHNPIPPSGAGKWPARLKALWGRIKRGWPVAVVIVSAFSGVYLYNLFFPPPLPLTKSEVDDSIQQTMASATPEPPFSSQVYQVILPSLVFIQTQQKDDLNKEGYGIGTGVVVSDGGEILTSLHVVADATEIRIVFSDGTETTAEVIAAEPENDIAVLAPGRPPELIVPAVLGSPGSMRVGDEAYAVGNPLGLTASLSAGVISGFNRSIPIDGSDRRLEGLIQFDTAVNPGNSGGPLLNRRGQVIGIVTALANPFDQNVFAGIGFAVPILTAVSTAGGPSY
jgi:S1-C subfamily serine protease